VGRGSRERFSHLPIKFSNLTSPFKSTPILPVRLARYHKRRGKAQFGSTRVKLSKTAHIPISQAKSLSGSTDYQHSLNAGSLHLRLETPLLATGWLGQRFWNVFRVVSHGGGQ
jgi:hypothetical protein